MTLTLALCLSAVASVSAQTATFTAGELLGKPTDTSVSINVVPASAIQYRYVYGTSPGADTFQTTVVDAEAGQPSNATIGGLSPNTRYYYHMVYDADGSVTDGDYETRDESSFWTQRAVGESFAFTVTSDIHNSGQQNVMTNIFNEAPDFTVDCGDTFMTGDAGITSESAARSRYISHRGPSNFGKIGPSVPIFLAPGNHEDEEGWNLDDTGTNATGLWNLATRKAYFPMPTDGEGGGFYAGNNDPLPTAVGGDTQRQDYYAWEWGDALFVVIDEFQYTMNLPYSPAAGERSDDAVTGDQWSWTLGAQQYEWLTQTLEDSDANYKFVFSHNMLGGVPRAVAGAGAGYVRGGAEAAAYFEWGGKNADGSDGFAEHRPGWPKTIHQLFVDNGVSAYFHGHDHQYCYETRDGVVYQEVPSGGGMGSGFSGIYTEGDHGSYNTIEQQISGIGHLRVSIASDHATVDYVSGANTAGTVNYSYQVEPITPSTEPVINVSGSLVPFASEPGSPSETQGYSVSGSHLTDDIVLTAPADFELSKTGSGGWLTSLALTPSSGTVPPTTIYVRFNRATAGTSSGSIGHSSTGASTKTQAVSGTATTPSSDLADANIATIPNQTYTGTSLTPAITVTLGADTLVRDVDYTVAYSDNTNAGPATVTATGIGAYTGSKQAHFTIVKATPSVTAWPSASSILRGQALSASTLTGGTHSVPGGFAFVSPGTVPPSAGTYTASVAFNPIDSGNYNSVTGSVAVLVESTGPVYISGASVAPIPNQTYTGTPLTPAVTVTYDAHTLVKDTDYTVAYAGNIHAGTATVTITGI
ncbi:MAG TPA: metallophosphoesterase, partial [Coriobacteriia bacterium]|nr:metallophosphoesterase [Coriobacteriia bacterium]